MKNIYLLDTNIICEVAKPEPSENIVTNLELYSRNCAISSITWYELLNGAALLKDGKRKRELLTFLIDYVQPSFEILPYDEHAAFMNSEITKQLKPIGLPTPILDTQIASVAKANNLIMVTKNIKDFKAFQEHCSLMLEEW